jgi:hypothetical protein
MYASTSTGTIWGFWCTGVLSADYGARRTIWGFWCTGVLSADYGARRTIWSFWCTLALTMVVSCGPQERSGDCGGDNAETPAGLFTTPAAPLELLIARAGRFVAPIVPLKLLIAAAGLLIAPAVSFSDAAWHPGVAPGVIRLETLWSREGDGNVVAGCKCSAVDLACTCRSALLASPLTTVRRSAFDTFSASQRCTILRTIAQPFQATSCVQRCIPKSRHFKLHVVRFSFQIQL